MKRVNNIKVLLLSGALMLSTVGCSDSFLDQEPLNEKTESNFYKTKEDAALAINGVYDGLQRIWEDYPAFPFISSVLSDNAFGGTGASDGFAAQMMDEFDKNRSTADLNLYENLWADYYAAIYRANKYLQEEGNIDWEGDDALRAQYQSEARFVRAFCYFDLARMFGNIPLLEEPTTDNVPQADPAEVYSLIGSDLQFAAENLSATAYSAGWAAQSDGRVTKWAAESLLGRVFLYYTGYYNQASLPTKDGSISDAQALQYLEDVITNSGHDLVADYTTLWPAANPDNYVGEGNIETVFALKYTYTSDYNGNMDGNHWMVMNGMRNTNSYPYGQGWGGATVTEDFYNTFSADDARKFASIIAIEDEAIDIDISTQREYTGFYIKKYTPMVDEDGNSTAVNQGGVNFQIGQYQDFVSIRFADVLLMAAELGSANAQTYFNRVRERALGAAYTELPLTEERLREERRLELAFEGIRYWDLLRYGLDVAANAINVTDVEVFNAGQAVSKSITFDASMEGLQQIPYNQINLSNGTLQQNTGW
ncbi:RagB/SusD family nutrient uptake outer membrane protein [Roseivirga pacifica]|uniref:RagB/SusD family nutrient uptake outer membrane protein n=1 Tax=Roseivirga pacifica TaxID=1267423 RepID=UPI00227A38DB|nr:RagB/SusD family nutrient uptake outer membrane protein [Roseivirga pacifica]